MFKHRMWRWKRNFRTESMLLIWCSEEARSLSTNPVFNNTSTFMSVKLFFCQLCLDQVKSVFFSIFSDFLDLVKEAIAHFCIIFWETQHMYPIWTVGKFFYIYSVAAKDDKRPNLIYCTECQNAFVKPYVEIYNYVNPVQIIINWRLIIFATIR